MLKQMPSLDCHFQPIQLQSLRRKSVFNLRIWIQIPPSKTQTNLPATALQLKKQSTANRPMSLKPELIIQQIHSSIIRQIFQTFPLPFHNYSKPSRMMPSFKTLNTVPTKPFMIAIQKCTPKMETQRLSSQRLLWMQRSSGVTTPFDMLAQTDCSEPCHSFSVPQD